MRKQITIDEKEEIVRLYTQEHLNQQKIAKLMHRCTNTIKNILIEYNVHKTIQETNISKYSINDNFFDVNNQSFESAYVMGLIAADGCISKVDNQVYIELQRKDRELLEKVNFALKNEREVKDYITGKGYENSKIYFYNKKMKDDLKKFHLIPNKTYSKEYSYPDLLNEEYELAFIRGIFDGDGCITITEKSHTPKWQIDSSSEDVIKWIINIFKKYDIKLCQNLDQKSNIILHRCNTSQKEYINKIYNLLYNNPKEKNPIYMQRKKDRFEEILSIVNKTPRDCLSSD